jgi:saccharopine dehydrogenase-like NADP-dependent oxidoreductase
MKNILVLGAGRTATALIEYLLKNAADNDWFIYVADHSSDAAMEKVSGYSRGKALQFDILNEEERDREIKNAYLVISFLPPSLHYYAAISCLKNNSHLITASYLSYEMKAMDKEAKKKGLIFLNEMGLDPGIDHMDAVKTIEAVKSEGGRIISFKSFCGGLISPESDNNPWGYKFTWSPMNVVLAGQGIARYIHNYRIKIVPYSRLFLNTEIFAIPGVGEYEAYPNRDSLAYLKHYKLENVKDFYRGTLRKPGYSRGWNALIQLGLTDNSYKIPDSDQLTYKEWLSSYLPVLNGRTIKKEVADFLEVSTVNEIIEKIEWLGLLSDKRIKIANATPAEILLKLLEEKWKLNENDRDLVVLQSEVKYEIDEVKRKSISTMTLTGKEKLHTAMTNSAGLPAAIGAKLLMQNKIKQRGVIIPVFPEIYEPALKELEEYGIKFTTRNKKLSEDWILA